jgi:hypothetical protein
MVGQQIAQTVSKHILNIESGNHDENLSVITTVYGADKLARLTGCSPSGGFEFSK